MGPSEEQRQRIDDALSHIERDEGVRVLYACESGSRAWGFASADSDWDVRFIYVHPTDGYLSLASPPDTIERPITDDLDLAGWDLKKALLLMRKSNPPLFEWLRSPIVYRENSFFTEGMRALVPVYFNPKGSIFHYLNMASGNFRKYLQADRVKRKKYFYVLRPILACLWILGRDAMAPMEFEVLLHGANLEADLVADIRALLAEKRSGSEMGLGPRLPRVDAFLRDRLAFLEQAAHESRPRPPMGLRDLDALFRAAVRLTW